MPPTKIIAFLTAVVDFVLVGLLSNGFIIAVLTTEWAKSRNFPACEQLLLSLGISNICATFVLTLNLFTSIATSNITIIHSNHLLFYLFHVIGFSVGFLRYWLTAWLCVFYCIKILNSTHSFFLWWKMRISRLVPRLILGSCVVSFFASSLMVYSFPRVYHSNETVNIRTITPNEKIREIWKLSNYLFLLIASGCPLLVVFLCSVMVVSSLCKHVCKIMSKGSNLRSLQTEAHVKATRAVLSLLFLYISFYVAQTVDLMLVLQRTPTSIFICFTVMLLYSPVQGAILVLSNPKLKQKASRILRRTKS